jgi:phytoene/squalene synthetase
MRVVDDLVDDRKATGGRLTEPEIRQYQRVIENWTEALMTGKAADDFQGGLIDTIRKFQIPDWPWRRLARAMVYDLSHDGFSTFLTFLRYAEGAAIGPASIFMHLCGVQQTEKGYLPPDFDIRWAARPLAVFSYLVHIIRDFQIDQIHNLNYFPDQMLKAYRLDLPDLRSVAAGGKIPDEFRQLMAKYFDLTERYRLMARTHIDDILPFLKPRYRLSLELIYSLYLQIFEKIDPKQGSFTKEELNPSPDEIQRRIEQTISSFKSTN